MRRIALLILCASCKQHKPPPVESVMLTDTFGCVQIVNAGRACFGDLPNGTSALVATPYDGPIPDGPGAAAVAKGAHHTCKLLENGTVVCWGANDRHQLADGSTNPRETPAPIMGLMGVKSLVAAGDSTCALMKTEVRCWGANDHGQLGDGSKNEHPVPMPLRFARSP